LVLPYLLTFHFHLPLFFFVVPLPSLIYTLSLHDALPIFCDFLASLLYVLALGRGLHHLSEGIVCAALITANEWRLRGGKNGIWVDRKSTRLNSSHGSISYAVFCLKKKTHSEDTFVCSDLY